MTNETPHSGENDVTLTTSERWRLHASTELDNMPSKVAERLIEERDPAVIEAVESIFSARLAVIEDTIREGAGPYVGHPDRWGIQERRDAVWRDRLRAALSIAKEGDHG